MRPSQLSRPLRLMRDTTNDFAAEVHTLAMRALPFAMDPAIKQDLAQEICIELVQHREKLDPARSLASWVGGAARLKVREFLRARRRRLATAESYHALRVAEPAPVWGDPHAVLELQEAIAIGRRLVAAMPPVRRAIWIAVTMHEQPLAGVAAARGISLATVKTHLRLASETMRAAANAHQLEGR